MPRPTPDSASLTQISSRCAELFISAGDASPSVADLSAAAGISPRTFHRYFQTKHDCLRPLFEAGNEVFAASLAAQPDGTGVPDALSAALEASFADRSDASTRVLMAVVFGDPGLRRVWLEAVHETARLIRPSVARLLGTAEDSIATTVAAGQVIVLVTAALEHLVTDGRPLADLGAEAAAAAFPERPATHSEGSSRS